MTIAEGLVAVALIGVGFALARVWACHVALQAAIIKPSSDSTRHEELERANRELRVLAERLQLQAADLEEARASAVQASRAKTDFLANVSHEIRTPMTTIVGMTDLALELAEAPEQVRHLRAVKTSAGHLLTLINDLLDLSKIEANQLDLSPVAFRLRETIGDVLTLLARPAHAKGLALVHDIDQRVPDFLVGDVGRVRQLLLNLVGNAVKFTSRGEVVVQITPEAATTDELSLHIAVADTGVGIAPDKQETVFAAFQQADGSTTRRFGGTGLGLTICAELARLMGGRLWLESTLGRGTTFHVTARVRRQARPSARPGLTPPPTLQDRRVLLVEPHEATRVAVARMLDGWRVHVDQAATTAEADRALTAHRGRYAAVLIASRLPHESGFDLATRMHEACPSGSPLIMMITTEDERRDQARSRALGAVVVSKPIAHRELLAVLSGTLEGHAPDDRSPSAAEGSTTDRPARQLHLLVAEDNPLNQELIRTLLSRRGHTPVLVETGREAVELAMQEAFDGILMDIQMPELDGFAATRAIRNRERGSGRHTPIVALTAGTADANHDRCDEAGMDGYLSKPIDAASLFQVVESLAAPPSSATQRTSSSSALDADELMRRIDGDVELLRRMADAFLGDCPRTLGMLDVAIRRQDARAVEHAAHFIKGAAANLCAPALAAAASDLERAGRDGDLTRAEDLRDDVLSRLEALRGDLVRAVQARERASATPVGRTA